MRRVLILLLLSTYIYLPAQNLVPNPSFEGCKRIPMGWMANDHAFKGSVKNWTSPNGGSPDLFFEKTNPFKAKRRKVDTEPHKARTGKFMVGIKTYGCISKTTHCKEYIQVKLKEPLVQGEFYYVEFWVNPIKTSILVNNIGAYVSEYEMMGGDGEEAMMLLPNVNETKMLTAEPNKWMKISGTFEAGAALEYLMIGNFFMDEDTQHKAVEGGLEYSYYLIDDVILRHRDSKADIEEGLAAESLEAGKTITLNNIFFDTDKSELLPTSFEELNQLKDILNKNFKMTIEIRGHTDSKGDNAYNLSLSERRAKAVYDYLTTKGITSNRLNFKGFGESKPKATNATETGRQENRRVEMMILTK